jgi:hypothetical protein
MTPLNNSKGKVLTERKYTMTDRIEERKRITYIKS